MSEHTCALSACSKVLQRQALFRWLTVTRCLDVDHKGMGLHLHLSTGGYIAAVQVCLVSFRGRLECFIPGDADASEAIKIEFLSLLQQFPTSHGTGTEHRGWVKKTCALIRCVGCGSVSSTSCILEVEGGGRFLLDPPGRETHCILD